LFRYPARQLIFVGNSNAVHYESKFLPNTLDFPNTAFMPPWSVTSQSPQFFGAEFCASADPFFKRFALGREGELGARLTGGRQSRQAIYRGCLAIPRTNRVFFQLNPEACSPALHSRLRHA